CIALILVNTRAPNRHRLGAKFDPPKEQSMESDAFAGKTGLSAARLSRMHETLLRHVERGRLPGLVALIDRRGAEHVDVIGTLAFGSAAPMRRDTIFRLAS